MRILKIKYETKWIVANSTKLISPAGHHPSEKVVGLKEGVTIKQYICENQRVAERAALKDFPNAKELMIWNVEEHFAKYN